MVGLGLHNLKFLKVTQFLIFQDVASFAHISHLALAGHTLIPNLAEVVAWTHSSYGTWAINLLKVREGTVFVASSLSAADVCLLRILVRVALVKISYVKMSARYSFTFLINSLHAVFFYYGRQLAAGVGLGIALVGAASERWGTLSTSPSCEESVIEWSARPSSVGFFYGMLQTSYK